MTPRRPPLIVVSNTSPLTNLAAIGQLDLLHLIFGHLSIPQSVFGELTFGGISWPGAAEVASAGWIHIRQVEPTHLIDALRLELDRGEAEAIALALQLKADLILIDEQAGREAARYLGLNVMGVVGFLVRAKQLGHIENVLPHLDALRQQAGFYLSESVYRHALSLAGEVST